MHEATFNTPATNSCARPGKGPPRYYDVRTQGYILWVKRDIAPNVAATVFFRGSVEDAEGRTLHRKASLCEEQIRMLFDRLSSRILKHGYTRYKKRIRAVAMGEGDMNGLMTERWKRTAGKPPHVHLCLQKPEWCAFEDFANALKEEWLKSEWAHEDIWVEPIKDNWIEYCFKDGADALLVNATSL